MHIHTCSACKLLKFRSRLLLGFGVFSAFTGSVQAAELRNFLNNLNPLLIATPGHQTDFLGAEAQLVQRANASLNAALSSTLDTTVFNPSVIGLSFDVTQGLPVRTIESLGPIVGDRADTLGANRFDFGFGFTHIRYTKFGGQPLDDFKTVIPVSTSASPIPQCNPAPAAQPSWVCDTVQGQSDFHFTEDVYVFSGTYGITQNWDVGFVLPIVHLSASVKADATINYASTLDSCRVQTPCTHQFDPAQPGFVNAFTIDQAESGSATGIGDLVLRTKYNFLQQMSDFTDAAIIGQVRVPTGDENQLLGSGSTDFMGMLVLSKQLGIIAPHLNVSYEVASGGFDTDSLRYVAGADVAVIPSLTLAADVFGRALKTGQDEVNFAFGAKWALFDRGLVFGNVIVPLNSNVGLRADYIWTVGGQIDF